MSSEDLGNLAGQVSEADRLYAEEFWKQFNQLSEADLKRVEAAALGFRRVLGETAASLEPDEVLSETLVRFTTGRRKITPGVDLVQQLIRAMQSVAYGWGKRAYTGDVSLKEAIYVPASWKSVLEEIIEAEQQALLEEIVDRVFSEDPVAGKVLMLKLRGYSGAESERHLGISPEAREAARKRAERRLPVVVDQMRTAVRTPAA